MKDQSLGPQKMQAWGDLSLRAEKAWERCSSVVEGIEVWEFVDLAIRGALLFRGSKESRKNRILHDPTV